MNCPIARVRVPAFLSCLLLSAVIVSTSAFAGDDGDRYREYSSSSYEYSRDDDDHHSSDDEHDALRIESAKWDSGDRELEVRGRARDERTVTIKNATTGDIIGSTRANDYGYWRFKRENPNSVPCRVRAESDGDSEERDVYRAPSDCDDGGGGTPPPTSGDFTVLAANDLGMHCADLDYQIFSILPPFNVVHAQVIERGTASALPRIRDNSAIDVYYEAASSPDDPVAANSINTTSDNINGIFKTNFWDPSGTPLPAGTPGAGFDWTWGGLTYAPLYPGVQVLDQVGFPSFDDLCDDPANQLGCPSALALFEPLPVDRGIPVPDPAEFYPADPNAPPLAMLDQQDMPGVSNTPQKFHRFDHDLPFFVNFDFGSRVPDVNWFAADGIPIMPVDDSGRSNAYPLMKVSAHDKSSGSELASLDVVLPVASEADCQNCHVEPIDCQAVPEVDPSLCTGEGINRTPFNVYTLDDNPPGQTELERLLNTAKINILRVHDAKHGAAYKNWNVNGQFVDANCDAQADPNDPDCLVNQTPIQCSRCHYSPALDLLQTGPVDEPEQGLSGRQQTYHITMSRAMHGHHGTLPLDPSQPFDRDNNALFPAMPAPDANNSRGDVNDLLNETCYQCHPGKRTECLRGAMFAGGIICQDCHGDMEQVGNDFSMRVSTDNPGDFILSGALRVPWANEPGCQSCHTGDALNPNHPVGAVVADDGIRLLQAFVTDNIPVSGVSGSVRVANVYQAPDSPFAENQNTNANGDTVPVLYRLSKGHGGVMCEGCHNSTHAIWPNQNPFANDNVAAQQLQGHHGTITECVTCHEPTRDGLPLGMGGPHGMHPIADHNGPDARWNEGHEDFAEHETTSCQTCHGANGEGTVLSRAAADRLLECDSSRGTLCDREHQMITIPKGHEIGCVECHENEIDGHH